MKKLDKNRRYLFIVFVSIVVAMLNVAGGLALGKMLKAVESKNMTALFQSGIQTLIIWIAFYVFYKIMKDITASYRKTVNNEIRHRWSNHAAYMKNENWEKTDKASYLSHYLNEIAIIDEKYLTSLFNLFYECPSICFSLISIFWIHSSLGIVSILLFFLIFLTPNIFKKKMEENAVELQNCTSKVTNKFQDLINGRLDYNIYLSSIEYTDTMDETSDLLENQQLKTNKYENFASCVISSTGLFAQVVLIFVASLLVINNKTSIGSILSIGNIAGTFFSSTSGFISDYTIIHANKKMLTAIPDEVEYHEKNNENFECINIRNLESIKINQDIDVKYNIKNLLIKKNEKVLLTGESGVGKSILLNSLFYAPRNYEGSIVINHSELKDDTMMVPFKDVAYVTQAPHIFNNTLRFNLTLGKNISEEKLFQVIQDLKLDSFDKKKEEILEIELSNNGGNVSGGEAMRICIARAILQEKKVLVMDEPFAALDEKTAEVITNYLESLKDMTIIITGHRLNENITHIFTDIVELKKMDK